MPLTKAYHVFKIHYAIILGQGVLYGIRVRYTMVPGLKIKDGLYKGLSQVFSYRMTFVQTMDWFTSSF